LISAQLHAMEDQKASKLMPEITLSEDAKNLIKLSGNSPSFTCMSRQHNPKLAHWINNQIQTLDALLNKVDNPYDELNSEDYRKAADDHAVLQAWLSLLPGQKRDRYIEKFFIEMVITDNYVPISWFDAHNLKADQFDPGFLETLAKIAAHRYNQPLEAFLSSLKNPKDMNKRNP